MQDADLEGRIDAFKELLDPRRERNQEHALMSIVVIAICGADNWVDIEGYGTAKEDWLETLVVLPNGIPSPDTFGRVFRFMNPESLSRALFRLGASTTASVILIDPFLGSNSG